jgi:hypothetical protein
LDNETEQILELELNESAAQLLKGSIILIYKDKES